MYRRNLYLERIRPYLGKPVVKVLSGMRRVGKSYLMRQIINLLREDGVPVENILYIDKESLDFEDIATHRDLNRAAKTALSERQGPRFLLVDEIQEITDWEKAIASLGGEGDIDLIITGSNAHLFSSQLASRLSGRYVEFPVYALSFSEHLLFRGEKQGALQDEYIDYMRFGGLPAIHHFERDEEVVYQYVTSVFNTILLKDIVKRHEVRNVALLERVARYLFDNVGRVMSAKSIADYLKSQRLRVGVETVQNYLAYFEEALVAHKAQRYDIKGKRLLETHEKYFLGDVGMRHAVLGFREGELSGVLENIVYLELRRRGYTVHIGKLGVYEVDFIATREKEKLYIQVAYLLATPEVIAREFGVLQAIPDNYPKLVLSMDTAFGEDIEGVQRQNLVEFLTGGS
ncbi:MAG: ATP-binding protein [Lentisphaerae bacterium]|nr:ATP-binding protein [Lentisphaerota bacterium]